MSMYSFVSRFAVVLTLAIIVLPGASAWADGTEVLGSPSIPIASGSGIVAAGVGLFSQPGDLVVEIPAGVDVKQVILYWSGFNTATTTTPTMTISVGGSSVPGNLIGGPTQFFESNYAATYRADITALGLIGVGTNTLAIDGMSFYKVNHGAGLFVIIDDALSTSDIQIVDGTDTAYIGFPDPHQTTIEKTFSFAAATSPREADLVMHFGSVEGQDFPGDRPTTIKVTVGTDEHLFTNLLMSNDGEEWDSLTIPIHIPSDVTTVKVQALSEDNEATGNKPASFVWVGAGLSIPVLLPPPPTGGEGCTPGYWKNHLDSWGPIGLNPGDDFDAIFGVDYFDPDITLEEAVNLNGGKLKKVARHGTAALLNALHPEVDYPVSVADVIAAVQAGDVDDLEMYNELSESCPAE